MKDRKLIFILALAIFCGIGILYLYSHPTRPKKVATSNESGVFLPNFSNIRAVANRDNEKWIAAEVAVRIKDGKASFYSQKDGLVANNTTDVVNYDGQIWFGSQGGVSKFVDSTNTFKQYLKGAGNTRLFVDPQDNILYATTFKESYSYNKSTDTWEEISSEFAPVNSYMVFTPGFILATGSQQTDPAVFYNKATKAWAKADLPDFGSQQNIRLFQKSGRTFIYGRSKEYDSCDDYLKQASSIFFEFVNGNWLPAPALNDFFRNLEPDITLNDEGSDEITFATISSCDEAKRNYNLEYIFKIGTQEINLLKQNDLPAGYYYDAFKDTRDEISNISGLKAYHKILFFDGNIIYTQTSNSVEYNPNNFSVSKITVESNGEFKETEIIPKENFYSNNNFYIQECDGLKYLISFYMNGYDGTVSDKKIFQIDDETADELTPDADLPSDKNELFCHNNRLYSSNSHDLFKLTIEDSKISGEKIAHLDDTGVEIVDLDQNSIYYLPYKSRDTLTSLNLATLQISSVILPMIDLGSKILEVNNESIYIFKDQVIYRYNRNGNKLDEVSVKGNLAGFQYLKDNKYLISTPDSCSIIDWANSTSTPVSSAHFPYYDRPTTFMPENSSFDFLKSGDNIFFSATWASAGSFMLPIGSLH